MIQKELRIYSTFEGKEPFVDWIDCLKDKIGKHILLIDLTELHWEITEIVNPLVMVLWN